MRRSTNRQMELSEYAPRGRPRAAKHNKSTKRGRKRTGKSAAARARPVAHHARKKRVRVAGYCVKSYVRRRPKTAKRPVKRRTRRARRVKRRS